ncbi:MAG: M24 family metallopeptidase [Polyangia bacterium]|jgi:Xaa-Pro aminopeptidase|nr:M24 family metallopeptidase [Polyangia bacterium]
MSIAPVPLDLPRADHAGRVSRLAAALGAAAVDAAIIMQHVDLFYFTGTIPSGALVVTAEGRFAMGVMKGLGRARVESSLPEEAIQSIRSPRDLPVLLASLGAPMPATIGLEEDVLPMAQGARILKSFPGAVSKDVSGVIRRMRSVKDASELAAMREAACRLGALFDEARGVVAPGRTELEVSAELERRMRLLGHQGIVRMRKFNGELYYGAIGTGRSTAAEQAFDGPVGVEGLYPAVPQLCASYVIQQADTFLLDLVFGVGGYLVDATRLYTFGPPEDRVRRAHDVALEIQAAAAAAMVPGAVPEAIYISALQRAEAAGLSREFMGWGPNQVRFLGHGVGLEIDELPVLAAGFRDPLEEGMTIALEPKFFFGPEAAAGLENTFLVRAQGPAESLIPEGHDIRVI